MARLSDLESLFLNRVLSLVRLRHRPWSISQRQVSAELTSAAVVLREEQRRRSPGATTRRMLTGQTPYVYEFTNPSQGFYGLWECEFYGTTAGACVKRAEGRFVFWMLRQ